MALHSPRPIEHVDSVVFKKRLLLDRKRAHSSAGVDAPLPQQVSADLGHDQELLGRGETDVALVEQVVDVG